jgi:PST family polysaccharide transporter
LTEKQQSEGLKIEAGATPVSNRKLAFGAIASGTVSLIKVGLQLLLLPVMARLLGPEEFGIYALALPTVSFVALLADGGLGATLAREPETSSLVWSSAFWFLVFTGFALALGASAFGVLLAELVHQPRVSAMIALLSLSLVFLVLSVPAGARLTRRRNLGVGAAAELTANWLFEAPGRGVWSRNICRPTRSAPSPLTFRRSRCRDLNSACARSDRTWHRGAF